jgi:hypothetical protein
MVAEVGEKIPPGRAAYPIAMAALAREQAGLVAMEDSLNSYTGLSMNAATSRGWLSSMA